MIKVSMVYGGFLNQCDVVGNPMPGRMYFDQAEVFNGVKIRSGFVVDVDLIHFYIPEEMGVEVDPLIHKLGSANPAKDAYEKHCCNVKDYTKAYKAFGKDRMLDYQVQLGKNYKIDETSND